MHATSYQASGWATQATAVRTPRDIEYEAFARTTRALQQASADHAAGDPTAFARLAAAVHQNRRLWSLLAEDLSSPANRLPDDLRARLIYLAAFTLHHSGRILSMEDNADALVDINMAVMRGLQGRVE